MCSEVANSRATLISIGFVKRTERDGAQIIEKIIKKISIGAETGVT
jgi:hypothetical protein